jgi:ubiquinone/menaquinone biosynthesis C-methylase UbiE
MPENRYLMEHEEEALRLDLKTDRTAVNRQALWAGLKPGMRVADIGCGSGKTTSFLFDLVSPSGSAVGIDASEPRLEHARKSYGVDGIEFVKRDIGQPLVDLGTFDFVWIRFVLEYHHAHAGTIVRNLLPLLKPGGILCLIDLDHNCLSHYGLSPRLERTIGELMALIERDFDFDPYMGRKLYSFLYDNKFENIAVELAAHHLIYGTLNEVDAYNWTRKIEVAAQSSGYAFPEYPGGYEEFFREFQTFFTDQRRFTYTPLIICRGTMP